MNVSAVWQLFFWLRQELRELVCPSVHPSRTSLSKALNLHLSLISLYQIYLRSLSGHSQVSLRSGARLCNTNILSFSANIDINNGWNENKKFRVDAKKTKDNSRKDNKFKIKIYWVGLAVSCYWHSSATHKDIGHDWHDDQSENMMDMMTNTQSWLSIGVPSHFSPNFCIPK